MTQDLIAGIDAGGTSFKCLIAEQDGTIIASKRVPTKEPEETVSASANVLRALILARTHVSRLGIASFGPLDLVKGSPTFGSLLKTPKQGWSQFNLKAAFEREFPNWKVSIDLDVSAALSAELAWGAGADLATCAYVTVGTGIGVGLIVNRTRIDQSDHPEVGHISVTRAPFEMEGFRSVCDFHADCLEGFASAPALIERFGGSPEDWTDAHPAWSLEAYYLAQLCRTLTYSVRPQKIILGGGVMNKSHIHALTRQAFVKATNGYSVGRVGELSRYIVAPGLGEKSGELGAIQVALQNK